jgi:hypothetical protein
VTPLTPAESRILGGPEAGATPKNPTVDEAILDAPLNIAVTCDWTRGGRHTLGRYTQPQVASYSAALAEGFGVGWVSFFDERQLADELGVPPHVEVEEHLCVGYVESFRASRSWPRLVGPGGVRSRGRCMTRGGASGPCQEET